MSKVKDTVNNKSSEPTWTKRIHKYLRQGLSLGSEWTITGYMILRHVGWFVVTVGMITALPLIFEIKREALVEEMEQIQINNAIADGKTPQEIASSGLTAAIDPNVLK